MQELYRKINSQLSVIERKLLVVLKRFYNKYIRGKIDPVEIIRQQRGGYVWNLIRKTVIDSISLGGITITNIDTIGTPTGDLITSQYDQFWKTVSKLRMREDELKTVAESQLVAPGVIPRSEKKQEFNVEASLLGFTGWLAFAAFNTSMLFFALDSNNEVIFMTVGDKKVDKKICRPLHGRTFNANDPLIPKPPLHLFCRCMLLPSIS